MKRLYLLAAAVSVTGGMAFSAPQEDAPEKEAAVLDVQTPPSGKQDQPAIPERLLDDSHMNEELVFLFFLIISSPDSILLEEARTVKK